MLTLKYNTVEREEAQSCPKPVTLSSPQSGFTLRITQWPSPWAALMSSRFPPLQHIHSRSTLECAYRTHLVAGIGFYQHLLLYIQSHYQLELQCCIDWTHVTDPLIGQCSVRGAWARPQAQAACFGIQEILVFFFSDQPVLCLGRTMLSFPRRCSVVYFL